MRRSGRVETFKDIDTARGSVRVLVGKGGKVRTAGIDGRNDISTTARYLDHICPLQLVEAVRARAW